VRDDASLEAALAWRDDRGGSIFWLTPADALYPALAIRVSGALADAHYLPRDGHPGLRCLGGDGLPEGGLTRLVYQGCDPATGEETPNEFIVPFQTMRSVAREFFHSNRMSGVVAWFEL
jgi:hypothetical protein